MPAYAHKVDTTQAIIVEALIRAGCIVEILSGAGGGVPDLLVGFYDFGTPHLCFIETKSKYGKLTPAQQKFKQKFAGFLIWVCSTPEEALRCVGKYE
jgi:hypothetical protein